MPEPDLADRCAALARRLSDLPEAAPPAGAEARPLTDLLAGARAELSELAAAAREQAARCQFLGHLFDLAPDGHLVTDPGGTIREVNRAATTLLQAQDEALAGQPLGDYIAEPDRPLFRDQLDRLRTPPEPGHGLHEFQVTVRTHRGQTFPAGLTVAVLPDGGGRSDVLQWVVRDITERQAIEQHLRRSEARLQAILDTALSGVLTVGDGGAVESLNRAAERMFGYSEAEAAGRHIVELLPVVQLHPGGVAVAGAPAVGTVRESLGRRKDGSEFPVELAVSETRVDDRRFFTVVARDITQRVEARERLLQAERLAAIGATVAGLAHESRNAFQRSQAALERLSLRLAGRPEEQALVAEVQQAQDHLHHLYEQVRSYAAPIRLDLQPCDLGAVWRDAWAHLAPQRAGRQAELVEVTGAVEPSCAADPFRLEQVFRNILENALAATPDPVTVTVRTAPAQLGDRPAVRITVTDNGPGLTQEQRRRIFEPFFTTKTHGTGLGMAIARRIVEAHGGTIAAGGGPGAEIVITLPRESG